MAVQIQMAQPADLAGEFLKGVQTGNQIRAEKARLAQEQSQQAAQLQQAAAQQKQRAQQFQQEQAVQQQRIQVTQAYNQQKAAMRQQQLDQVEKVNAEKTQAAARQYQARQMWQQEFSKIDADDSLSEEQKDTAKSRAVMRLAPSMGIAGTEAASMLREMRPPKPTVPASVEDKGDFMQVTQPNGTVTLHPKRSAAEKDPNVKVMLPDASGEGQAITTMPKSQAMQVIPNLPPQWQTNALNKAVMSGATPQKSGKPSAPKAGDVYKGHKFKGGNPSQAENWEKVDQDEQ